MSSPQARARRRRPAPEQPAVPTAAASPTPSEPAALPAAARPQSRDSRLTLLEALKPLLREEKRGKIDSLQRAMTMASVLKGLR